MKDFIKAILGGVMIAISGVIYLTLENHIVGALLFSIGLYVIYTFDFYLFTGKICFIPFEKPSYLLRVLKILMGNIVGAMLIGYVLRFTKKANLIEYAIEYSGIKLSDTLFSTLIMGILCGFIVSIAVLGFSSVKDGFGRCYIIVVPIMAFILSGYEHSIANAFYFSFANVWSLKTILYFIIVVLGNTIGGMIISYAIYKVDGKKIGYESHEY